MTPPAGEVLLDPVVPSAGERLAVRELADAVEARPLPETRRAGCSGVVSCQPLMAH
jgi:hypothetical protein